MKFQWGKWSSANISSFSAIHELDYLKKGVSMLATNARESIRFIDRVVSNEDDLINSKLILETPSEVGPNWKKCMDYKIRSPKVHEFPNNKTSVVSKPDLIKYESEEVNNDSTTSHQGLPNRAMRKQRAELPARFKYLIRPCIKKTHIDEEEWALITEDLSTKIWCESFGISCINLTEAESLLFQKINGLQINDDDPTSALKNFSIQDHSNSKAISGKKRRSRKKNGVDDNVKETTVNKNGRGAENTRIESFDSISYAPRGSGELWVP